MTANEIKFEFDVLYDKISSNGAPGYTDNELSTILSKAEEQVVRRKAPLIDKDERTMKELGRLVKSTSPTVSTYTTGLFPNGVFYEIPNSVFRVISEILMVTNYCGNEVLAKVRPIGYDRYVSNLENPFWSPKEGTAWRLDSSDGTTRLHQIITSDPITSYSIKYITKPEGINLSNGTTSLTDDSMHREIIEEAVRIATGITSPELYQVKINENSINN